MEKYNIQEIKYVGRFKPTDMVYIITDPDQLKRQITNVSISGTGSVMYTVCCEAQTTQHYDFELSDTKDVVLKNS